MPRDHQAVVRAVRTIINLGPVFLSLPLFWMLFDQQGSSWTLQAKAMNLWGLLPEQIGVVNPLLIMALIPLFDKVIYPALRRRGYSLSPLSRMGAGMVLSCISFLCSAAVQRAIEARGTGQVAIIWQMPQILIMSIAEILVSVTGLNLLIRVAR